MLVRVYDSSLIPLETSCRNFSFHSEGTNNFLWVVELSPSLLE